MSTCKVNEKLRPLLVPVEGLIEDPTNARVHTERNLKAIAYSLHTYGQQKPISLSPDGKTVLAENGTLVAARSLGWTEIAAIPFDSDEAIVQAGWKLADNRTAELASWDMEVLAQQLDAMGVDDVDMASLGWTEAEMQAITDSFMTPEGAVTDPRNEWQGMPEYAQKNEDSFRRIVVHFKSHEDAREFAAKLGQEITDNTRAIWYPYVPYENTTDRHYGDADQPVSAGE